MDSTVPINDKLEIVKNSCDKAKHEEKDRCVQKTDVFKNSCNFTMTTNCTNLSCTSCVTG